MPTLEPPPHRGPFSKKQLIEAAARLLSQSSHSDDPLEPTYLEKGKLTLITAPSNAVRSRFIVGLIDGVMDSGRAQKTPGILYFNRRWTDQEAAKALIQQAANRMLGGDLTDYKDVLILAIEHIERSGLVYDNTARTINEICRRVSGQALPPKLVVVDGLEHFNPETGEGNPDTTLPEMLNQLKGLAKETRRPIIVSSPALGHTLPIN